MELYGDGLQWDLLGRVHKYQIVMYTCKIEIPGYQYYHNSNTYIYTYMHTLHGKMKNKAMKNA